MERTTFYQAKVIDLYLAADDIEHYLYQESALIFTSPQKALTSLLNELNLKSLKTLEFKIGDELEPTSQIFQFEDIDTEILVWKTEFVE